MTMTIPRGTHLLVFPYPAQGHMLALLDLTRHLATTNPGLTLTVLVTPANLPLLNPLLSSTPNIQTLTLPFPSNSSLPPGAENSKDLPPHLLSKLFQALAGLRDPLLDWFRAHTSPPVAIISDMLLGWTDHLARQLGIPRVVFCPSGAKAMALIYFLWKNMPTSSSEDEFIVFDRVPNCPKCPWWQVSPVYRSYVKGDTLSEFARDMSLANMESWGMVVNTFDGIELDYLDHLRGDLGHDRVWAVGPVSGDPNRNGQRGGPTSTEVLTWLDGREEGKVVYVCFGSLAVLGKAQMEALAEALESSGAQFVWCVKQPPKDDMQGQYGRVPAGFSERVAGRGLVVTGWVPQVAILEHRAVGSFLTHCGWNSVLEGLAAGVRMLAWPMVADQFTNATLLVDDLKVGVTVCQGAKAVPDSVELARVLAESVSGRPVDDEMIKRAATIREAAIGATKPGGSSSRQVEDLVKRLVSLKLSAP